MFVVKVWLLKCWWFIMELKWRTPWKSHRARGSLLIWARLLWWYIICDSQREATTSSWLTWSKCLWCVRNKLRRYSWENTAASTEIGLRLCFRNNRRRATSKSLYSSAIHIDMACLYFYLLWITETCKVGFIFTENSKAPPDMPNTSSFGGLAHEV